MGGKTQTTQQQSSSTPTGFPLLADIYNRVSQVASQPYTPYNNPMVAGLSGTQQAGIQGITNAQGAAQPYFDQAAQYAQNGAAAIDPSQIQRYMSPYTQNVIDATKANFRQDNAIGQQQVIGNAAAKGALGGDRIGVAQAELARQQGLAQNPVIAGLENQNYTQALGAAQQDRAAQAQGAYTYGALAPSVQNAKISGAQAQIGAGGLEQGTQQAQLTADYNKYLQQLAFPYQQAGFLASAGLPAVNAMGGTTTGQTTTPGPNPWSQVAGLGLTAASFLKDGGVVKGYAGGGPVGLFDIDTYIPKFSGAQSMSPYGRPPALPKIGAPQASGFNPTVGQVGGAVNGLKSIFGGAFQPEGGNYDFNMTGAIPSSVTGMVGGGLARGGRVSGQIFSSGGRVKDKHARFHETVHAIRQTLRGGYDSGGYADGGPVSAGVRDALVYALRARAQREGGPAAINIPEFSPPNLPRIGIDSGYYGRPQVSAEANIPIGDSNLGIRGSYKSDSLAPEWALRGSLSRGFADGGDVTQRFDDAFSPYAVPPDNTPANRELAQAIGDKYQPEGEIALNAGAPMPRPRPFEAPGVPVGSIPPPDDGGLPPQITGAPAAPSDAMAYNGVPQSPYAAPITDASSASPAPSGVSAPSAAPTKGLFGNPFGLSDEARQGLLAAGLGTLASRSPFALSAIGEGGLTGLKSYTEQKASKQKLDSEARKLTQQAEQFAQNLGLHRDQFAEQKRHARVAESMAQKPTLSVVGRDEYGNPKYGIFDPRDQSVKPVPPLGGTPQLTSPDVGPTSEAIKPPAPPPARLSAEDDALPKTSTLVSGNDAFLQGLPEKERDMVKAMVEGRQPPPPGKALATPYWQRMVQLANQYDTGFDMGRWASRVQTRKNFAIGTEGRAIRSLNTVANHLGELDDAGKALDNFKSSSLGPATQTANQALTWYREHSGDPRITRFDTTANAVSTELEKAFRGSQTAISGIREWRKTISAAASPEQKVEANKTLSKLLLGQLEGFAAQYSRGMGVNADPLTLLEPNAAKVFQKLLGTLPEGMETKPQAATPAAPTASSRPSGVPEGSQFSPSRKMWRDPSGKIYDAQGNPVQ